MAYIKINDILKRRGKKPAQIIPQAVEGTRIQVLVGGCSHCQKLRDNVLEAAKQLDIPESDITVITDLAAIVRMGIMATPALIVDGRLASVGKVLSVEQVKPLIEPKAED